MSLQVEADGEIVVITGMSGAGRTEAAKVLEDLGYYVVDNLPPSLIGKVVELAGQPGSSVDRLAVVADVRGREFFGELTDAITELRDHAGEVRLLFLEADDDTLVRRFEASRRRHPLGDSGADGVLEGIQKERQILEDLRGAADLVVDTTDLNVHELRDRLVDAFGGGVEASMHVNVTSFGFKYGLPRDADLVIDVRFLPNPHWVDELRPYTGLDGPVRDYVLEQPETQPFIERLEALLDVVVPGYVAEGKSYLTIAFGCTGGKHRSVVIAEEIARYLEAEAGCPVHVDHRDTGRE